MSEKIRNANGTDNPSNHPDNSTPGKSRKTLLWRIPENIKKAIYSKCDAAYRKRDARDWVGLFVNVIMLGTVIVYTGAALRQTKLMRRALEETRINGSAQEQLTRDSVGRTVGAMTDQLDVMRRQLDEMRNSQRPWIKDSNIAISSPVIVNERITHIPINYVLTNTGRQPAFDVNVHAISHILWTRVPAGAPVNQIILEGGKFIKDWPTLDDIQPLVNDTNGAINSAYVTRSICSLLHKKNALKDESRSIAEQLSGEHVGYNVYISGVTIFPDEDISDSYVIHEPNDSQTVKRPADATSFILAVTACAQYRMGSGEYIHSTGATYIFDAVDMANPENVVTLGLGDKAISHVKWVPKLRGRYAD